jgi:hypothetical protein
MTTDRKCEVTYLKCEHTHLPYCRQARTPQGADAFRHQPRRGREVRKKAMRWGQSETSRCKLVFVAGLLRNALSTVKGIMNSHVNLSPIKLSAKGSVGWNSEAEGILVTCQGKNSLQAILTDAIKNRGTFQPILCAGTHRLIFPYAWFWAQLLCSAFS